MGHRHGDESSLASDVYSKLSICIELRKKYYGLSLQNQLVRPSCAKVSSLMLVSLGDDGIMKFHDDFTCNLPIGSNENLEEKIENSVSKTKLFDQLEFLTPDQNSNHVTESNLIHKSEENLNFSKIDLNTTVSTSISITQENNFAPNHPISKPSDHIPSVQEYYRDLETLSSIIHDGPTRTLAFRRLRSLQAEFGMYRMEWEGAERGEQKRTLHRDFYNVRKVDTHVHHSSSMNCKHLLRFIKNKLKTEPDCIVYYDSIKGEMTLKELFSDLGLDAYDLNIDVIDMHSHQDAYQRFDRFVLKYNPMGEARLRTVFLKTDNHIKGRYLAEITRQVIDELEESKYQMVEWRLSIYGRSRDEWHKLARWVVDNNLESENVRWLIQIPRLYSEHKRSGHLTSFGELLQNVFQPLFEALVQGADETLDRFLSRVVGFDCVDDESRPERDLANILPPNDYIFDYEPTYTYWMYYLYSNIASLNQLCARLNRPSFVFRPHSGEAGEPDHLASAFLLAHGINHGITLRKTPPLCYLFYLEQIGIAMSPLSNNRLFLHYDRNPFQAYFQSGLNVSLSTDDPLQFHFTREPLIEEYSVAAQIYRLGPADMCEIARNSVLQSGFDNFLKKQWLGANCTLEGPRGNDIVKTNVPMRRLAFRYAQICRERSLVDGIPRTRMEKSPLEQMYDLNIMSAVIPDETSRVSLVEQTSALDDADLCEEYGAD